MAILPIVQYPEEILEAECRPVTDVDKHIKSLLDNMHETMLEADGVGLAAPQVNVDLQVAVVDIGDESGIIELINPEILEATGEQTDVEGCLSFPGLYGEVTRPYYVKVRAMNRRGELYVIEAEDFLARALQHEIDHLHGILFTTKIDRYVSEEELEGCETE